MSITAEMPGYGTFKEFNVAKYFWEFLEFFDYSLSQRGKLNF